ncbi:MAG TPA: hypothetical protein VNT79_18275 [Phycisphaerae bacterium]|nr:hypothetical protein [Phycisphaerae bacterium]
MADPISQADYDNAAAVFSRSVSFIEWRFVIAADPDRADGIPTPFGDQDQDRRKATVDVDRRKWIYVFSTPTQKKYIAEPTFVDEVRIDKGGAMAATPHDDRDKPIKSRKESESIGKTLCLPRRILGIPHVYRFFASRVRLEKEQIDKLKKSVEFLCPPVIFDPDQNNSLIDEKGKWLVPIVDPVTVMLHLHAAYCAAADDVVNYTIAYKGNPHQKKVETRGKKHVLAMLLRSIVGDYTNTAGHNMANELKDSDGPINDFLKHYNGQLQWRVERRDRLAMFLVRWLSADAVRVLGDACRAAGPGEWIKFLVPWCRAITRLSESPVGRKYLNLVVDTKNHFVHDVILPEKEFAPDAPEYQAVRKGGMTILEGWKSLVEARILKYKPTELAELAQKTLGNLQRKLIWRGKYSFPPMGIKEGFAYSFGLRKAIDYHGLEAKGVEPVHDHFSGKKKAIGPLIESLNFVFAVMTYQEAMKGDDPQKKDLALIGLIGSSLDAASALGSLFKKSEKLVATISFVSGIIDVYLAHKEMDSAFKGGDQDAANGAFLVGAGASVGVSATLMVLMGIPGGQIVAVIGLLIVAIGYLFKFSTSKTPIEHFFAHCTWGKLHGQAGLPDWSPTDYSTWTGDAGYDRQFEALLNIICDFKIESGSTFRDPVFKMGWLPPGSKLLIKYEEKWDTAADNRSVQGEVLLTDKGPNYSGAVIMATVSGKDLKINIARSELSKKDPHKGVYHPKHKRELNEDLKEILAQGQLQVTMDAIGTAQVPHAKSANKGWRKGEIFEA